MKLVVVESPAKAKTIEKYLGSGHRVLASFGHVRDLPPKDGSVDPDQGFEMQWQVSPDRSKQLKAIADEAKKADTLILATDPDREGEAISWHVQEVLRQKKALPADVQRVTFNAITSNAVTEAMKKPRGRPMASVTADLVMALNVTRSTLAGSAFFFRSTSCTCQLIASPSRSGSVARIKASAVFAASVISLSRFALSG